MGGPGSGGARPGAGAPALPDDVRERVLLGLRRGLPLVHAAAVTGIHKATVYAWIAADEAGDERYAGFARAVEIARHDGRATLLGRIIDAGVDPRAWTANAWVLERTDPETFAAADVVARRDKLRAETEAIKSGAAAGRVLVMPEVISIRDLDERTAGRLAERPSVQTERAAAPVPRDDDGA